MKLASLCQNTLQNLTSPEGSTRRLLYIGPGPLPLATSRNVEMAMTFAELSAQTLQEAHPDIIVFPLISRAQDAVTVIEALHGLGYKGACLVLCPPLPHPQQIKAELRAVGPAMQIRLLVGDTPI